MTRERILRQFETWLDEALAAEEPPSGIPPEILAEFTQNGPAATPDLYSLWSAMTALSQEVRLQGRTFKQLSDTLEPAAVAFAEARRMAADAERRVRKSALDALLDLRDRLVRGLDSARTAMAHVKPPEPHWLERLIGDRRAQSVAAADAAQALTNGYRLALERLDQLLEEWRVREIPSLGERFDPNSMNAIDTEERPGKEGIVLEVFRAGYEWNGEVYRTAQVKVGATAPSRVGAEPRPKAAETGER